MNKFITIIAFLIILISPGYSNILYNEKYLQINFVNENCGNHSIVGGVDTVLLKKRIGGPTTYDFKGRSLILKENKLLGSDKSLSLFYDYDFQKPIFDKEFELIYKTEKNYIFSAEFNNWPDKNFYKNIILIIINRNELMIDYASVYIENSKNYEFYKSIDFTNLDEDGQIGYSIEFTINDKFHTDPLDLIEDTISFAEYTPLTSCEIKEISKPKPKI